METQKIQGLPKTEESAGRNADGLELPPTDAIGLTAPILLESMSAEDRWNHIIHRLNNFEGHQNIMNEQIQWLGRNTYIRDDKSKSPPPTGLDIVLVETPRSTSLQMLEHPHPSSSCDPKHIAHGRSGPLCVEHDQLAESSKSSLVLFIRIFLQQLR